MSDLSTEGPPAFEEWYEASYRDVAATLTLACGDADIAEEAAAEAFARALASWRRVGTMASPTGWVYTVALNEVRGHWRRSRLERRALARHQGRSPAHLPPPEPTDPALWRHVAALPPRQREAISLRYVADLTETQVADAMGVARGTIAATLSQARRALACALRDDAARADAAECGVAGALPPSVIPIRRVSPGTQTASKPAGGQDAATRPSAQAPRTLPILAQEIS